MTAILFASLILKYILWKENKRRDHLTPEQRKNELSMRGEEPCDSVRSDGLKIYLLYLFYFYFSILISDM